MTIFANDYTDRNLVGTGALIFKVVNTLLTIVPMIILTFILYLLFKNTFEIKMTTAGSINKTHLIVKVYGKIDQKG